LSDFLNFITNIYITINLGKNKLYDIFSLLFLINKNVFLGGVFSYKNKIKYKCENSKEGVSNKNGQ